MENLNIRYSNLYLTPNCSFCNQLENTIHLLTCSLHSTNSNNILLTHIQNHLTTLKILNISSQLIFETIHSYFNSLLTTSNQIILFLIQGTIPISLINSLKLQLKKLTINFFILLSNSLLEWFNNSIWNIRNQKHHEWETLRNISTKKRKTTYILPTQHTNIYRSLYSFNTNIDNYISKFLLQNFTVFSCFY